VIDKKKQGKRNRINGAIFEKRVRLDLESKDWTVSKWQNNVELEYKKLVPAKMGRFRSNQGGFPDFIAFKNVDLHRFACDKCGKLNVFDYHNTHEIIGVEVKTNGYLTKEEKAKCEWYLENQIFSKILIAKKIKNGRKVEVEYNEFKD